jgi:hypothetical protein
MNKPKYADPPFDHLAVETALLLEAPLEDRLKHIDVDYFLSWNLADKALSMLDWLLGLPEGPRRRCLMILADSGMGKTWLLREFLKRHGIDRRTLLTVDGRRPVFLVSMAALSKEKDFLARIMGRLGAPYSRTADPSNIKEEVVRLIIAANTQLYIFDECQDLGDMNATDIKSLAKFLKHLCNEGERPLVVLGSVDSQVLLMRDAHLRSRFDLLILRPWSMVEETRRFMFGILASIPLPEPSPITDDESILQFLERTEGNTERIALSLKAAGRAALRELKSCFDLQFLLDHCVDIVGTGGGL